MEKQIDARFMIRQNEDGKYYVCHTEDGLGIEVNYRTQRGALAGHAAGMAAVDNDPDKAGSDWYISAANQHSYY